MKCTKPNCVCGTIATSVWHNPDAKPLIAKRHAPIDTPDELPPARPVPLPVRSPHANTSPRALTPLQRDILVEMRLWGTVTAQSLWRHLRAKGYVLNMATITGALTTLERMRIVTAADTSGTAFTVVSGPRQVSA